MGNLNFLKMETRIPNVANNGKSKDDNVDTRGIQHQPEFVQKIPLFGKKDYITE